MTSSQKTVKQYNKYFNLYLRWSNRKLFEITKSEVLDKFIEVTKLSPSSANGAVSLLGTLWKYMHVLYSSDEDPILRTNPVDVIAVTKGWNKIERRERHLDKEVIHKYYNAVLNYQDELNLENTVSTANTHRVYSFFIHNVYGLPMLRNAVSQNGLISILKYGTVVIKDTKNGGDHWFPIGEHLLSILKTVTHYARTIGFSCDENTNVSKHPCHLC